MSNVIDYLNIRFPQEPYTNIDFLNSANELLVNSKKWSKERILVELSILEIEFFARDEYELLFIRAHMQQLYGWLLHKHTVYVDKVYVGLNACGLPILPAFQKIMGIVSDQHLKKEEPIGNPSLKTVKKNETQKHGLILMAQLMFYLGDSKEKAAAKVQEHISKTYGPIRGCSAEHLEELFDPIYTNYVQKNDSRISSVERDYILSDLESMPDSLT